jgi:hypothetical protein
MNAPNYQKNEDLAASWRKALAERVANAAKTRDPSAALAIAWLEAVIAYYEKSIAGERKDSNASRLGLECDVAYAKVAALQDQYRAIFAASRGWRYDRRLHLYDLNHKATAEILHRAEGFRDKNGAIAGFVTHSHATPEEISAYSAKHGYNAELLPFSWLSPDGYESCVLLTLQTGAKWPK